MRSVVEDGVLQTFVQANTRTKAIVVRGPFHPVWVHFPRAQNSKKGVQESTPQNWGARDPVKLVFLRLRTSAILCEAGVPTEGRGEHNLKLFVRHNLENLRLCAILQKRRKDSGGSQPVLWERERVKPELRLRAPSCKRKDFGAPSPVPCYERERS